MSVHVALLSNKMLKLLETGKQRRPPSRNDAASPVRSEPPFRPAFLYLGGGGFLRVLSADVSEVGDGWGRSGAGRFLLISGIVSEKQMFTLPPLS